MQKRVTSETDQGTSNSTEGVPGAETKEYKGNYHNKLSQTFWTRTELYTF